MAPNDNYKLPNTLIYYQSWKSVLCLRHNAARAKVLISVLSLLKNKGY